MTDGILTLDKLTIKLAKAEIYQNIHVSISEVLAATPSVKNALPRILHTVASSLNMELAIFWKLNNSNALTFHSYWQTPLRNFSSFIDKSQSLVFTMAQSVPGRVLSETTPVWISGFGDSTYLRSKEAKNEGLQTSVAFPITIDLSVIGVIELFSVVNKQPDEELLEFLVNIGYRIGQYIKRRELEKELIDEKMKYRWVTEFAPVAIVVSDVNGMIIEWNHEAENMFGWKKHQVLGQPITIVMPERFRTPHTEGLQRIHKADDTYGNRFIGEVDNISGLHKDGSEFPIKSYLSTWKVQDARFYSAVMMRA